MKMLKCGGPDCDRTIEVPDKQPKVFCSIECACYAGEFSVRINARLPKPCVFFGLGQLRHQYWLMSRGCKVDEGLVRSAMVAFENVDYLPGVNQSLEEFMKAPSKLALSGIISQIEEAESALYS